LFLELTGNQGIHDFVFAALATGAFPTRAELNGQEAGEGLFTYFKLSAIAVGVAIGKRTRRNNQKP
jgi:hypothetical protein